MNHFQKIFFTDLAEKAWENLNVGEEQDFIGRLKMCGLVPLAERLESYLQTDQEVKETAWERMNHPR